MIKLNSKQFFNQFKFYNYQETDFEDLMQLWMVTGLGNPQRGDDKNVINRTIEIGGKVLLIKSLQDSKIIGSSWMTMDGRRLYLHHFAILPEYQGIGLGDFLLDESMNFAKSLKLQLKLEVHQSNYKAIALYQKFGFKTLGKYEVYIIRDILQ